MTEDAHNGLCTNNPVLEKGAPTPRRSGGESRAELLASLGAAGVVLYVLLRFPLAIFYGTLGTSPEEVGLGYVQLLAQSSVLVAAVAGLAALLSSVVWAAISWQVWKRDRRLPLEGPKGVLTREAIAATSDDEFLQVINMSRQRYATSRVWRQVHSPRLALVARLRDLDRQDLLTGTDKREQQKMARRSLSFANAVRSMAALTPRLARPFVWWFLGWSLLFLLVGLPVIAAGQARLVRDCQRADYLPGLNIAAKPIQLLNGDTLSPQFADRELVLLGGDSNKYVLFDCQHDATLRVPTSNYVVVQTD